MFSPYQEQHDYSRRKQTFLVAHDYSSRSVTGEKICPSIHLFLYLYLQSPPPSPTTTMARASSPLHTGRDPPTSPPPPLPTETDPYFNAFSRHYSFSVKHSQTRNKLTGSTTPTTSPKKVAPPRVCARATSFSVSSTSSHSSVSSLGSLIGSPSVESFPRPPTPLLSPGYSGDLQSDPLPPPPFPGAVPTLPHPGKDVQLSKICVKCVWY